jgi:hypothetical protein
LDGFFAILRLSTLLVDLLYKGLDPLQFVLRIVEHKPEDRRVPRLEILADFVLDESFGLRQRVLRFGPIARRPEDRNINLRLFQVLSRLDAKDRDQPEAGVIQVAQDDLADEELDAARHTKNAPGRFGLPCAQDGIETGCGMCPARREVPRS